MDNNANGNGNIAKCPYLGGLLRESAGVERLTRLVAQPIKSKYSSSALFSF